MSESARISLDNPTFYGRLRAPKKDDLVEQRRPSQRFQSRTRFDQQVKRSLGKHNVVAPVSPVWMRPLSRPATKSSSLTAINQTHSTPLSQNLATLSLAGASIADIPALPNVNTDKRLLRPRLPIQLRKYSKVQIALFCMALVIFAIGIVVSLQTVQTNRKAAAQVTSLSKHASGSTSVPSTTKPKSQAVSNYTVAPDLPRYLKIPKLGVNARILQVGVTDSGALATPSNVYDTAWYTGSAKPGQPGAMLIDGHVSSWTTHGVFYGLKTLHAGDRIQIQRGDGKVFTYSVVKTQTYSDTNVDMEAAMRPITAGKPGLNLITCAGKVKPGTSEFNQRIIVFAQQN